MTAWAHVWQNCAPAHLCFISVLFLFYFDVEAPHWSPSYNPSVCYVLTCRIRQIICCDTGWNKQTAEEGEGITPYKGEERREATGSAHLPRQKQQPHCTDNAVCWVALNGTDFTCQDFVRKESQDIKGTEQNLCLFIKAKSSTVNLPSVIFCALWQHKCLPLLLVTITLTTALCSSWEHPGATP